MSDQDAFVVPPRDDSLLFDVVEIEYRRPRRMLQIKLECFGVKMSVFWVSFQAKYDSSLADDSDSGALYV